jgi:serine/threonine protein kinase
VTELLDTNLCQFLQIRKDLNPRVKIKIAADIAEAMSFLHSRNIIHRDLKSVNVLLNCGLELVAKVTPLPHPSISSILFLSPLRQFTAPPSPPFLPVFTFSLSSLHLPAIILSNSPIRLGVRFWVK